MGDYAEAMIEQMGFSGRRVGKPAPLPYKCPKCDERFFFSGQRRRHMKNKHRLKFNKHGQVVPLEHCQ